MDATALANRRTAIKLAGLAVAMFGFGYLLAPLYDVFCDITGLNGKTGRIEAGQAAAIGVDPARTITIEFTGNAADGLPWEFRPVEKRVEVHPGETHTINYYARNTSAEPITGRAVPSVTPSSAGAYFKKIECFCFTEQRFAPGEGRAMPVRFVVDPGIDPTVRTITLSYTFFNISKTVATPAGG